jgi:branched-subunit amino acid aminotransferase/4-amino-4-deoxychorismate lyase
MKEAVFLNGKFISSKKALISVFEPGFLYGWGLFETMRSLNGKIVYFDEHLRRIKNSCAGVRLKFPYSINKAKGIIKEAVKINGFKDSYVRLTFFKTINARGILIIAKKYKPFSTKIYKSGFRACISALRQDEKSPLAQIKTTSRILYQLSYTEAKRRGFDEALILNNKNYIAEGSRANIFLVKNKRIFTPSVNCGCLSGITRKVIFDLARESGVNITEGNLSINDLKGADEVFLTSSLMGVMPLVSMEGRNIAGGKPGRLTGFFGNKYNALLKGERDARH